MNRPKQIREVYTELRRQLGNNVPSGDVLEAASTLVDLFSIPEDEASPQFDLRIGGVPFYLWSTDVALADGGWRVMGYEPAFAREIEEQEECEVSALRGFRTISEGLYQWPQLNSAPN